MDEIIFQFEMLKEDRGNIYISDEEIKECILENIDILIKEIAEEVR